MMVMVSCPYNVRKKVKMVRPIEFQGNFHIHSLVNNTCYKIPRKIKLCKFYHGTSYLLNILQI